MKKVLFAILILLLCVVLIAALSSNCEKEKKEKDKVEDVEPTIIFSEFKWPDSEIAKLLPIPKSNIGKVSWEASYGFVIDVGETTREQYDTYVDECRSMGFTVDYRKGDDYFHANNEAGYKISVTYKDNDTMWIRIDEPKNKPVDNPAAPDDGNPGNIKWREFLQEYEDWVDSYINLLNQYKDNPADLALMSEYLAQMEKLIEWTERADEFEDELWDDADALQEYLDTMLRILAKLSRVEY